MNSEVEPLNSEVEPLNSEVAPLNSTVEPLNSEVAPLNSEVAPLNFYLSTYPIPKRPAKPGVRGKSVVIIKNRAKRPKAALASSGSVTSFKLGRS